MEIGWIDIPDEIYHNSPEYRFTMTSSGLKQIDRSALHWYTWRTSPGGEPKPALHFGSAFHGYMLGDKQVLPVVKKIKYPKLLERERELGPKSNTILVSAEDFLHLSAMKEKLMANELAASLVNHPSAVYEQSGFFQDPDYGIIGSIKPDIRIPDLGIIVDLKTAADASHIGFSRSVRRFRYDWQAWWYLRGANALSHESYDTFIIIAIEKVPPYEINLFQIQEGLYWSEIQVRRLLERFELAIETSIWSGYPADEIIEL